MKRLDSVNSIDLNLPLQGSEGLDKNYTSRIRSQYLFAQHQSLVTQSQFADAKAAAILAILGLLALRGPIEINIGSAVTDWVWYTYLGLMVLSVAFCLLAILPRYPNRKIRNEAARVDTWSWPSLSSERLNEMDYGLYMQTSEVSHLIYAVAHANRSIANILLTKFRMLRIALFLLLTTTAMALAHLLYSWWN
jgi:hypothetical protein